MKGAPAIRAYQAALAERFRCDLRLPVSADYRMKVKWTLEQNFDALIGLARFACEDRPEDFYAHLSLGIAFERAGRFGDAAASYETAIGKLKSLPAEQAAPIRARLEALRDEARKKGGDRDGALVSRLTRAAATRPGRRALESG